MSAIDETCYRIPVGDAVLGCGYAMAMRTVGADT
jgi:hypothetical protein